jgi:ribosomal protein L37AE/L43A
MKCPNCKSENSEHLGFGVWRCKDCGFTAHGCEWK